MRYINLHLHYITFTLHWLPDKSRIVCNTLPIYNCSSVITMLLCILYAQLANISLNNHGFTLNLARSFNYLARKDGRVYPRNE